MSRSCARLQLPRSKDRVSHWTCVVAKSCESMSVLVHSVINDSTGGHDLQMNAIDNKSGDKGMSVISDPRVIARGVIKREVCIIV